MDTTPLWFLASCAAILCTGWVVSTLIRVRRLRREDATQKGQNK